MEIVTKNNNHEYSNAHGCTSCYQVDKGYFEADNGLLVCKECGGTVLLGLQSVYDYVEYLKSRLGEQE